MPVDHDRIDEAVLALLYLTLHDGYRDWKGFDWNAMNRLHEITQPRMNDLLHGKISKFSLRR